MNRRNSDTDSNLSVFFGTLEVWMEEASYFFVAYFDISRSGN